MISVVHELIWMSEITLAFIELNMLLSYCESISCSLQLSNKPLRGSKHRAMDFKSRGLLSNSHNILAAGKYFD